MIVCEEGLCFGTSHCLHSLETTGCASVCVTVCMRSCWSDSTETAVRSQLFVVHMLQASPLYRHAESVALLAWEIRQAVCLEQTSMLVLNFKVGTDLGWMSKYKQLFFFFLFSACYCQALELMMIYFTSNEYKTNTQLAQQLSRVTICQETSLDNHSLLNFISKLIHRWWVKFRLVNSACFFRRVVVLTFFCLTGRKMLIHSL